MSPVAVPSGEQKAVLKLLVANAVAGSIIGKVRMFLRAYFWSVMADSRIAPQLVLSPVVLLLSALAFRVARPSASSSSPPKPGFSCRGRGSTSQVGGPPLPLMGQPGACPCLGTLCLKIPFAVVPRNEGTNRCHLWNPPRGSHGSSSRAGQDERGGG